MRTKYDLIIIGGGVLGTFHAYHALQLGLSVAIIEKDKAPRSATTQNFGQVVPSGMNSKWQKYGRTSLEIYKTIQSEFDISVRQNGTIYIASNDEEVQLIEELHKLNQENSYSSRLITKEECVAQYRGLNPKYARAGLYFPEEVTVEPRQMIHRLQEYLVNQKGLKLYKGVTALECERIAEGVRVSATKGVQIEATKVIICNGKDFKTLYPEHFEQSDLEVVKLQMMQTKPQPKTYTLKGSILTGWSIRRYEAFTECPSFKEIKANEDQNTLQKEWGVHILFKQAVDGSVILGDSHEYAAAKDADDLSFDHDIAIDEFMIDECKKIIALPTYELQHKWIGYYAQCKKQDVYLKTIDDHIHIVTGIGGKGMTGSAGFAKEHIQKIINK